MENSNFIMAEPLNAFQFPNNDHFIIQFVIQIIKKHITIYGIMFQVSYKTNKMPTHCLHKTTSV